MNCCREARDKGGFVECTKDDYYEALGALPPVKYFHRGFAMGEPYDGFGDSTRYYCFWVGEVKDGKFWCALLTLKQAASVFFNASTVPTLDVN